MTTVRHWGAAAAATPFPTLERRSIAVNTFTRQLAVGDEAAGSVGTPLPLIAVRYFDTRAPYALNDLVAQNGITYRAKAGISPGAFNASQWTVADGSDNVLRSGDTMTGDLKIQKSGPTLTLSKTASGQVAQIIGMNGTNYRWTIHLGDEILDSGGNAGSNFKIVSVSDDQGTAANRLTINRATGVVDIPTATPSTSPTTGALTVAGGVGISGALNVGGDITAKNGIVRFASGPTRYLFWTGVECHTDMSIRINEGTPSTSPTTGALVVAGGVGISGALHVASNILSGGQMTITYSSLVEYGCVFKTSSTSVNGYPCQFMNQANVQAGSIMFTAGQTGVTFNTTSDIRGKPNREPLSPDTARTIIDALEVYDFDKDGNAIRGIGLVAQQAHGVHKSLATPGRTDEDWWQAEKAAPMPFVIANMQQLNQRLDALERQLKEKH